MFPTRDQYVTYLDVHAQESGIDLLLGTRVTRIDRADDGWALETSRGQMRAKQVVVATGFEKEPVIPDWPGRETFSGYLLHSSSYRSSQPFEGLRVLVVGPGCSGMEMAHDLAEGGAQQVWLSVRTPPNLLLRASPGPVPNDFIGAALLHAPVRLADAITRLGQRTDTGDLSEYGLPFPEERVFARLRRLGVAPTIVDRAVIDAVKARRFEVVAAVRDLGRRHAHLDDGSRIEVDAIVCATGYHPGLEPLVGHLDVLDERGRPREVGERPAAPGLRFVGYVPRPGALGYMATEAKRTARKIAVELRAQ